MIPGSQFHASQSAKLFAAQVLQAAGVQLHLNCARKSATGETAQFFYYYSCAHTSNSRMEKSAGEQRGGLEKVSQKPLVPNLSDESKRKA